MGTTDQLEPWRAGESRLAPPGATPRVFAPEPTGPQAQANIADYWRVLLKRRWTIVVTIGIVLTATTIVSLKMTKIYSGKARIALTRDSSAAEVSTSPQAPAPVDDASDPVNIETQVKILSSDSLLTEVVRSLNLVQHASPAPAGSAHNPLQRTDSAQAERMVKSIISQNLHVANVPNTRIIEVLYESPDPRMAAAVPNQLISAYVEQNYKTKFESTMQAADWLSKQLADLQMRVESSEEKLAQYQKEHGIVGLNDKQNTITSKLDQINKELTDAEGERIHKEAILHSARGGDAHVLDSPLLQKLRTEETDLRSQAAVVSIQFGPAHPKVLEINRRLAENTAAQKAEAATVMGRMDGDYRTALAREQLLRKSLDAQKEEAHQLNESAIEYTMLKRDADSNRQLYDGLLQKLKEAGITAGLKSGNVRVIDRASVPDHPSSPNIWRNVLLALVFGLTGGIVLAFGQEILDNTIQTPDQVEQMIGLPNLVVIPTALAGGALKKYGTYGRALKGDTKPQEGQRETALALISHRTPRSELAECYRSLRTALLLSKPSAPPQVLLVTSALPEEGKTTTTLNTAIVMAQRGARVLVVDGDLRRPGVHRSLNVRSPRSGLSTLLAGGKAEVIQPLPDMPSLFVMPAGPLPPHPSELIGSPMMAKLIQQWRTEYEFIFLDSPPILTVTDPMLLTINADAVLLVVRSGRTTKAAVRRAEMMLRQVNAPVMGFVLNGVDLTSPDLYHYYYYGSKYYRGGYYGK
ncbi:MAG: GumC family protein [Terriglobales bacterium]